MNKDDIEQRTTEDAEQLSNKKDGDEDKKLDTSSKRLVSFLFNWRNEWY